MSKTQKILVSLVLLALIVAAGFYFFPLPQEPRVENFVGQPTGQNENLNSPSGQTQEPVVSGLPKFVFQGNGDGCGDILVYKTNSEDTMGISVIARQTTLGLSAEQKTFQIGETEGLNVEILTGQNIARLYCNDAIYPNQPKPKKLTAKSGTAAIQILDFNASLPEGNRKYKATVVLKNARFFDESGKEAGVVEDVMFKDITVGWFPG